MPEGRRAALVENLTGVMPEVSRLTQAEVIYPAELLTVSIETLTGWSAGVYESERKQTV